MWKTKIHTESLSFFFGAKRPMEWAIKLSLPKAVPGHQSQMKLPTSTSFTVTLSLWQRHFPTLWLRFGMFFLGVSKNRGFYPPKWMVKIMENPIKMDYLGLPLFLETPIFCTDQSNMANSQLFSQFHSTSSQFFFRRATSCAKRIPISWKSPSVLSWEGYRMGLKTWQWSSGLWPCSPR